MRMECELDLEYPSEGEAEAVLRSVAPEDKGYVLTRREGTHLIARATAPTPLSLLHTLEDYLACVAVAERVAAEAHGRR